MRRILTWALWILLVIVLAAVIYFVWTRFFTGNEESVGGTVELVCSTECANRGQCGTTVNDPQVQVVLGGLDGPAIDQGTQNVFIISGAVVEVRETWTGEVQQVNGRTFNEQFSRVELRNNFGDITKTGWFPDWCINNP